jgi:hypothetical protein
MPDFKEKRVFDYIWEKWLQFVSQNGIVVENPLITNLTITDPLTLYVETWGNDRNSGTSLAPFATIQAAIDYIKPFEIANLVKIKVGPGTFAPFIISGLKFKAGADYAQFLVEGTTSVVTSGTATLSLVDSTVFTDATKAWVTDEHVGRIVKYTTSVTAFTVIYANTATTLSVPLNQSSGTASYDILNLDTIITGSITTTPGIVSTQDTPLAPASSATIGIMGSTTGQSLSGQVSMRFLSVVNTTDTGISARGNAYFGMNACVVKRTTSGLTGCLNLGNTGSVTITSCLFWHTVANATALTVATTGTSPSLAMSTNAYLGSGTGTGASIVTAANQSAFSGFFKNWGIGLSLSTPVLNTGIFSFVNCTTGVAVSSGQFVSSSFFRANTCTTAVSLTNRARAQITATSGGFVSCTNGVVATTGSVAQIGSAVAFTTVTNELSVDGTVSTVAAMRASSPKIFPTTANAYGSYVYE